MLRMPAAFATMVLSTGYSELGLAVRLAADHNHGARIGSIVRVKPMTAPLVGAIAAVGRSI
jgi:hypothetical protein